MAVRNAATAQGSRSIVALTLMVEQGYDDVMELS
jgi:hypothetical protein